MFNNGGTSSNGTNSASVLILGAGMAGIAAGQRLTELGVTDFIILEGRDRIGGRIYSVNFGGYQFAAGPAWLHGKLNNPLTKVAHKCELQLRSSEYKSLAMRSSFGEDLTDLVEEPFQKITEVSETVFSDLEANTPTEDQTCREKWLAHGWIPRNTVEKTLDSFWFDFHYGLPAEHYSMLGDFLSEKTFEGDSKNNDFLMVSPDGFTRLVNSMKNEFLTDKDSRLRFNQVVRSIEWRETNCGKGVLVITETGAVYTADYAIITFPNSVLVSGDVTFHPQLPSKKLASLSQLRSNDYARIFVRFPATFWEPKDYILYASDQPSRLTVWQNAASCGLCPPGTPILIAHVVGSEAERVNKMNHSELVNEVSQVIRGMYPLTFLPPLEVRFVSLIDDPLSRGSFACAHAPLTPTIIDWMSKNCGPLHFAGDGTMLEYHGYLQGAYLTGRWAAEALSKSLILNNSKL